MSFSFPIANQTANRGRCLFLLAGDLVSSCALTVQANVKLRIKVPRSFGAFAVEVKVFNENKTEYLTSLVLSWYGLDGADDLYEAALNLRKLGVGLYWLQIEVETPVGVFYGYKCGEEIVFSNDAYDGALQQMSVSSFKYRASAKKYGGIIYHIFVDRFNRGGSVVRKNGAELIDCWDVIPEFPLYPGAPLKNNCFYGGTLYGIIDKLDYISSLGVDTIYLSPIFEAASNHKYDTADYMSVDSMFGSDEALTELITKAKAHGIGIILDGVFNHTGSDSIYFNRYSTYSTLGAYQSKASVFYNWYHFDEHPDKYTCWWGIDILPRINPNNPSCRNYFVGDGGVIDKYSSLGIDGFRLDVVDELSDSFVSKIKERLNRNNKSSVLYGEVWEDASNKIAYDVRKKYYLGEELDGVMNYPLRRGIIDYILRSETSSLRYALTDIINNAPERIRHMQMNLLGTHDTERILTVFGGEPSDGHTNEYLSTKRMTADERALGRTRLKLAYTILATVPGIPAIFYGDEAGLEGYHDPFNRMPYPWGNEDLELLDFYRLIGSIRRKNSVYKMGEFKLLHLDSRLLIFARFTNAYVYLTVINNSNDDLTLSFKDNTVGLISGIRYKSLFDVLLHGFTSEIFKLHRGIDFSFSYLD